MAGFADQMKQWAKGRSKGKADKGKAPFPPPKAGDKGSEEPEEGKEPPEGKEGGKPEPFGGKQAPPFTKETAPNPGKAKEPFGGKKAPPFGKSKEPLEAFAKKSKKG